MELTYETAVLIKDKKLLKLLALDKILEDIADYVCNYFGITRKQFESKYRNQQYVIARQVYCFLAYNSGKLISLSMVASKIGNKHHSTVLHSLKSIRDLCYTNDEFRAEMVHFLNHFGIDDRFLKNQSVHNKLVTL